MNEKIGCGGNFDHGGRGCLPQAYGGYHSLTWGMTINGFVGLILILTVRANSKNISNHGYCSFISHSSNHSQSLNLFFIQITIVLFGIAPYEFLVIILGLSPRLLSFVCSVLIF